jgi:poly(3-hydroxybutyrate) depolymerase
MMIQASALQEATASRKLTYHEIPGDRPREFFLYRPARERAGAPLVVSVHGIARNAAAHAYRLMEEAERYGVVVAAPLFSKARYGQYQQLLDAKSGARSDFALLDIMDAAQRLSSADASKILLFGYSGGAQFAHRFAMAHPARVTSAVLAAAGWYTFPLLGARYPYGLDAGGATLSFDPHGFLQVKYHVMVGDLDTERDNSLRQSKRLDRAQGHTRVERARNWVQVMQGLARELQVDASVSLLTLPSVGHSFVESVEKAALPRLVFERFATDCRMSPIQSGA